MAKAYKKLAVYDEQGHRRSLIWRFKVTKSDVYVGSHGMGQFKLSLHPQAEGGYSAWAYTKEFWETARSKIAQDRRASIVWHRVAPTPERPIVPAFRIIVPAESPALEDLEPPPPDSDRPEIQLRSARWEEAVVIEVAMSLLPPEVVSPGDNTRLEHVGTLGDGQHVYLIIWIAPFFWKDVKLPTSPAILPKKNLFGELPTWPNRIRVTLHGSGEDGVHFALDAPMFQPGVLKDTGVSEVKLAEFHGESATVQPKAAPLAWMARIGQSWLSRLRGRRHDN